MDEALENFRDLLERRFRDYRERNPRTSLRAFAQRLGTDHSTLSQILRGKRPLTAQTISTLGGALGLTSLQTEAFAYRERMVHWFAAKRTGEPEGPLTERLLQAVESSGGVTDSRTLALILGCSLDEINGILGLLLSVGTIQMEKDRWKVHPIQQKGSDHV